MFHSKGVPGLIPEFRIAGYHESGRPPRVWVFQSGAVCVMGMDGANMGPGLGSIYQDRTTAAHLIRFYFQYADRHSIQKSPKMFTVLILVKTMV